MGTLYFTVAYQWLGFFGWGFLNVSLAIFLNQARKATGEYDDRLSMERMDEARNWLVKEVKARRK